MSKRILALLLCVVMLIPALTACATLEEGDNGAYITMYLTDEIYDFDPVRAYYNSNAVNVVSLLFDTLFKLDKDGKVVPSLAKEYKIIENEELDEYVMEITLCDTKWSNGQTLTSQDVIYAWRRLLDQDNSYEAAALLFDIKNARVIKEGDEAPDILGVEDIGTTGLRITFEGKIDYDQFLLNLTSIATAPLSETTVSKNDDWAKKSSTIITSGPFKLAGIKYTETEEKATDDNAVGENGKPSGKDKKYSVMKLEYFTLERNRHYFRDNTEDVINSSVTPYRILVDCSMSDADLLQAYKDGKIFLMGDIPLSIRNDEYVQNNAQVSAGMSTSTLYLNLDKAPFNILEVRRALSLAIDRAAIAESVVFAEAATGLVPPAVFNTVPGKNNVLFRDDGENYLAATADVDGAKKLLSDKGITASDYSFSIKVAAYDEVNCAIAEAVAASWNALGFEVTVEKIETIQNNDYLKSLDDVPKDICDDLFAETIERRKFDVILYDATAFTANAYSMLAPFALSFSGMALGEEDYSLTANRSGYNCNEYNNLMEAIYMIPYFAGLDRESDYNYFGEEFYTEEEFKALYDRVKAVYELYNITPTTDSKVWVDQKAALLHCAEGILMRDMPVIPVVFEQNAILVSDQLENVDSIYYSVYAFRKTNLKDYNTYTYSVSGVDSEGNETTKQTSIFTDFPDIYWDKMGK